MKGSLITKTMTVIIYEPNTPAIEILGHAGYAERGRDILCAALSILMYTLNDALQGLDIKCGSGWARLDGSRATAQSPYGSAAQVFALISRGYRLLAQNYPEHIIYQEKHHVRINP